MFILKRRAIIVKNQNNFLFVCLSWSTWRSQETKKRLLRREKEAFKGGGMVGHNSMMEESGILGDVKVGREMGG